MKKELEQDAKMFGDARRSPIVTRVEAQAMRLTEIIPQEPITVILSEKGWVRSGRGHEIDGRTLSFKAGDGFKMQVPGKSNQVCYFMDSTGRSYTFLAHKLPSARGFGEPLSSILSPPSGASFVWMSMANTPGASSVLMPMCQVPAA